MPYSSILVQRGPRYSSEPGAHPLIPEDVQREIIEKATNRSGVRVTWFGLSSVYRRRRQFIRTVRSLRRLI